MGTRPTGDPATPAHSRILKYVKAPGAPDYVLGAAGVPQVTGGQVVSYRLNPSLSSAAERQDDHPTDVVVEDCLPAGQSLTTATPTPAVVSATTPAGAGIACGTGETYLEWDLGQRVPDQEIERALLRRPRLADDSRGDLHQHRIGDRVRRG